MLLLLLLLSSLSSQQDDQCQLPIAEARCFSLVSASVSAVRVYATLDDGDDDDEEQQR